MNSNNPVHLLPETLLHIYYFNGVLSLHQTFPEGFLGNWEEEGFSFLFFLAPADDFIDELLQEGRELEFIEHYTMTYAEWQGASRSPVKAGGITFLPAWIEMPVRSRGPDDNTIRLDAGLVFGDGMHPTSVTCIQAIEQTCRETSICSMLDLGTGSGVLSLAAALFGCRRVVAVDNNFLAARTARRNVERNGFDKQVLVVTGQAEACSALPADLLVANIHHEIMCRIVRTQGFLEKKRFILSGLQSREADDIVSILSDKPVVIHERIKTGAVWQTIIGGAERTG